MKAAKVVVGLAMVLCLTLVLAARLPQQNQEQPGMKANQADPGFEAAHDRLYSPEDRAKEANRLTQTLAPSLPDSPEAYAPLPHKNFIDDYILGRMEREHLPHAPLSNDSEFMRRVYLDATGFIPTLDQTREFLASKDPNKRDKLIDSLIGTEAFADQWAYHYGELMRENDDKFHQFTKQWIQADRPYNEVFYDIVTPVTKNAGGLPTAQFYDPTAYTNNRCIIWTDADHLKGFNRLDWIDEVTSDLGRIFLGMTLDCFSCHNGAGHADSVNLFLARKKRVDFWQQAAFFGKMRPIGNNSMGAGAQFQNGNSMFDDLAPGYNTGDDGQYVTAAENRFARDGKTYQPVFFLTGEKPKPGENPRKALGRILPQHIQFARAAVNIWWQKLMVIGLVEPYDGFDLDRLDPKNPPPAPWTIQPTNPELLEALAKDFQANNYSMQHVLKTIMKSNAYQLSTTFQGEWKDSYTQYHARRFARILTGPEAVDIVAQATDSPYTVRYYNETRQYVAQATNPQDFKGGGSKENLEVYAFMQAYYQSERALPPADKSMANPVQAMMMMGSPVVTSRISGRNTRVAKLLKSGKNDDAVIEELFLASLSRNPTTGEVEVAKRLISEKGRDKGVETVQWVLLNTPEFLLNH
jgi:Protein of unknown function (DUF1549)/Protein of unknown function (DUF1553)